MIAITIRLLCVAVFLAGVRVAAADEKVAPQPPQRIVSLAPSLTEILFAVGAGDRVVGVTSFCDYPPEAKSIKTVGDYFSLNVEAVVRVQPDLVVMLPSTAEHQKALQAFNIRCLVVTLESLDDIISAITTVGNAVGLPEAAERLSGKLNRAFQEVPRATEENPRVLVVVGHDKPVSSGVQNMYIAGQDGFYDRLVMLSGGTNVYNGALKYPQISREGLLRMAPDILIDIFPDPQQKDISVSELNDAWKKTFEGMDDMPCIYINTNDYSSIPGPRVARLLNDFQGQVAGTNTDWHKK